MNYAAVYQQQETWYGLTKTLLQFDPTHCRGRKLSGVWPWPFTAI
jgi:hypothetical protein